MARKSSRDNRKLDRKKWAVSMEGTHGESWQSLDDNIAEGAVLLAYPR
jgi:hypothetical protein